MRIKCLRTTAVWYGITRGSYSTFTTLLNILQAGLFLFLCIEIHGNPLKFEKKRWMNVFVTFKIFLQSNFSLINEVYQKLRKNKYSDRKLCKIQILCNDSISNFIFLNTNLIRWFWFLKDRSIVCRYSNIYFQN